MWVFYLISLPLTLGMVCTTLKYFAGPDVPRYVLFTVGYTWFCSLSIIILVPADIWTTIVGHDKGGIAFFWSWSYWGTFLLTWAVVPTIQGYEDADDFTMMERLKTSIRGNLVFYLCVGSIGFLGLVLLIIMHRNWTGGIMGLAMACSNTFGLVTGAFLLGFGLSEIPKSLWRNADWNYRQRVLSHRVAKMAVHLDDAHQEISNAIVVAQATSNQMSRRDPLRPYMDVIDKMLQQMLEEDPSFKPSGGRLGESDMEYDTDEKSMAALRCRLRRAREEYYRYKSEYMTYIMEALELEDIIKNYEHCYSNRWRYVSSFRDSRTGTFGTFLDTSELIWRCILRKQIQKLLAIALGCMSAAILLAEATLLPNGVDLSLFSLLINVVGKQEVLVQVAAFVPLMFMCICTYYSLFKIGMLMFYSITPRRTSSVSLLMICSMVARYAPPISYNFLNLIRLGGDQKTIFEKRMGNIDDAVPFFGKGFNKIYPLIMVVYTLLLVSNFFDRVIDFFGSWKRFKFQKEDDAMDGYDPSGVIILQKERSWLEQGRKLGEHVIPLARNFNDANMDIEAAVKIVDKGGVEMNVNSDSTKESEKVLQLQPPKEVNKRYNASRDAIVNKYKVFREQERKTSNTERPIQSASVSLLGSKDNLDQFTSSHLTVPPALASTWESMKSGFQSFKANIEVKKFLPLKQQIQETDLTTRDSSESLDDIFHRLKRHPKESPSGDLSEDYGTDIDPSR